MRWRQFKKKGEGKKKRNSDTQCSCLPPADQRLTGPQTLAATCQLLQFYFWAWHHMVWKMHLTRLGQLSWLSLLTTTCVSCTPADRAAWETGQSLTQCKHCSAINLIQSKIQNTAPCQSQWRELTIAGKISTWLLIIMLPDFLLLNIVSTGVEDGIAVWQMQIFLSCALKNHENASLSNWRVPCPFIIKSYPLVSSECTVNWATASEGESFLLSGQILECDLKYHNSNKINICLNQSLPELRSAHLNFCEHEGLSCLH